MDKYDSIIIGAGLSGLILARELKSRGQHVLILEKSKGVGGRIATRRIENLGFDHGAPKLDLSLQDKKNLGLNTDGYLLGGMTGLAKKLATDLEIKKDAKVMSIKKDDDFTLSTEQNETFKSDSLFLTAPLPQAIELLDQNNFQSLISHELRQITYHKAVLALFTFEGVLKSDPALSPQVDRGLHPEGYVLTLNPTESEIWFDKSEEEQAAYLKTLIQKMGEGKIRSFEVKKWRYTTPVTTLKDLHQKLMPGFFLLGDAFGGNPVESARSVLNVV